MATIDPLERAAALLRAVFVLSCHDIELALVRSGDSLLLRISYTLRSELVSKRVTYVVASLAGSTKGAEQSAIHAALADFQHGINWATSASGPLADLGPVMLPRAPDLGQRPSSP